MTREKFGGENMYGFVRKNLEGFAAGILAVVIVGAFVVASAFYSGDGCQASAAGLASPSPVASFTPTTEPTSVPTLAVDQLPNTGVGSC